MMIRTQIYLPEEMHAALLRLAQQQSTTLSNLVRHGANLVIKKKNPKAKLARLMKFLANPPKKYRSSLTGKQLVALMSKDRDE